MLKYFTLSAKETKRVNRRMRRSLASELGMKCNAICSAYSDYTSENRTKRGTYNTRNVSARHFSVAKVGNNIKYDGAHFVTS